MVCFPRLSGTFCGVFQDLLWCVFHDFLGLSKFELWSTEPLYAKAKLHVRDTVSFG